jgi:inner membrane protein
LRKTTTAWLRRRQEFHPIFAAESPPAGLSGAAGAGEARAFTGRLTMPEQPAVPFPTALLTGRSPVLKVIGIVVLVLAFMVPLVVILDVIGERTDRRAGAIAEIGESWGQAQRVFGPVLIIPYREALTEADIAMKRQPVEREAHLLPDRYVIASRVEPELRRRGLFEAVVYRANLDVSGDFVVPDPAEWAPKGATILWDAARVMLDVRDRRSLSAGIALRWRDGRLIPFAPSRNESGLSALVPLSAATAGQPLEFAVSLVLKGSDTLGFLPLGRDTHVTATSTWSDPSFTGRYLPDTRTVTDKGFDAAWTVSYFARNYPQIMTYGVGIQSFAKNIDQSEFGFRLMSAVPAYQQAERSVKYGLLIIAGTFTTLFLFEVIQGLRIHIFQYGLVGLSLCIFYLLLVSLSEQVGFAAAYLAASTAVVGQILLYCHPAVGGMRGTAILGGLLALTYGALYQLMLLEDQALLIGAIGLFAALSAIMVVTRRIDWYAIGPRAPRPQADSA